MRDVDDGRALPGHVRRAQVVQCGDDLSGHTRDHRSWQIRREVRGGLGELPGSAALRLAAGSG